MTYDEIHALADKHCDGYMDEHGDCIGYEFLLDSFEVVMRAAFNAGIEAAAKVADKDTASCCNWRVANRIRKLEMKP